MAYRESLEWDKIDAFSTDFNVVTSRQGSLACFCQSDMHIQEEYLVRLTDGTESFYPICEKFDADTNAILGLGTLASAVGYYIVFISFVLRKIFIMLLECVRAPQSSIIASATMYSVLIVSFFNAGITYIIAPWSFRETDSLTHSFFDGIYTDFNSQWFKDIGALIAETTLINVIAPTAEALAFYGLRLLGRAIDQRTCCPCDKRNTNAKTIQKFEAVYSGPLFFVHYRLAFIVNITYLTFLFGPGMPLLFPIALLGIIFNYVSERIRMAYSYQKPPMYDSSLSQHTLRALLIAPVFYALMAAWLFSNQQVFRNSVPVSNDGHLWPLNDHKFTQSFEQITPGTVFVCFIILSIVYAILWRCCRCCRADKGEQGVEDMVILESLDPFYSVLKNKDREFWFREEVVARERIGMSRISRTNFMHLIFAQPGVLTP